jgi:hypothetical protein
MTELEEYLRFEIAWTLNAQCLINRLVFSGPATYIHACDGLGLPDDMSLGYVIGIVVPYFVHTPFYFTLQRLCWDTT